MDKTVRFAIPIELRGGSRVCWQGETESSVLAGVSEGHLAEQIRAKNASAPQGKRDDTRRENPIVLTVLAAFVLAAPPPAPPRCPVMQALDSGN